MTRRATWGRGVAVWLLAVGLLAPLARDLLGAVAPGGASGFAPPPAMCVPNCPNKTLTPETKNCGNAVLCEDDGGDYESCLTGSH